MATCRPSSHAATLDGYRGQGLVVGDLDGSAGVKYPVAGNFDLERGTLSLWVQPLNWDGDTRCYRLLFRAWLAQGGQFLLYRNTTADTPHLGQSASARLAARPVAPCRRHLVPFRGHGHLRGR